MKIAAYHGPHGKRDTVRFVKGLDPALKESSWDRIYITTLFSFEYKKIAEQIDFALEVAGGRADRVFVGGIAASLMHERFLNEPKWSGDCYRSRQRLRFSSTNSAKSSILMTEMAHQSRIWCPITPFWTK